MVQRIVGICLSINYILKENQNIQKINQCQYNSIDGFPLQTQYPLCTKATRALSLTHARGCLDGRLDPVIMKQTICTLSNEKY